MQEVDVEQTSRSRPDHPEARALVDGGGLDAGSAIRHRGSDRGPDGHVETVGGNVRVYVVKTSGTKGEPLNPNPPKDVLGDSP